ncbi:MAG TPA: hypothetical protein PKD70_11150 [Saprospiraceae bacterium]|nr:hypothetical protein [Saprospiraceae bacterium]HMP14428.1 hypothetical protein [Saprospiraceae bacterium]
MDFRFNKTNGELCISVAAIAEAMGIELNSGLNTIWKGLERYRKGTSEAWRHYTDETDGRKRWIAVAALPEVTRLRVEYHYNDLWLIYYTERLITEALARVEPEDRTYFMNVRPTKDGKGIQPAKVSQLCEACGWLRLSVSDYWKDKYKRYSVFLEWMAKLLGERDLYGLRVSNPRSLERKVKAWQQDGRESLLPRSFGNSNRQKLEGLQVKRIVYLYSSPLKPTVMDVHDVYNREADERGWGTVSYERVRQIVNMPEYKQVIYLARHGKDAAKNAHERTIKRRRPSFADALWVSDGSTIQLYYTGKDGKPRSDLYAYVVADAYSDAIIGWAVGYTETATIVQSAFRDAVRKTMMTPHQIAYDNSSANKGKESQQLFDKLSKLHFPTAPYSGKAKVIEAIWGRLEQHNMRHLPNFKGGNITAKSLDAKANPDFLAQLLRAGELPSFDQVVAQFRLVVETMNNTVSKKYKRTPAERYKDKSARRKPMDLLLMIEGFWVERTNQARYTKDGITIEIDKQRYTYEVECERGVEDMDFRMKHIGDSFNIKYDPDDLEYIALYKSGVHVATARHKYEAPMARVDIQYGEGEIISKNITQRRAYWQRLQQHSEEIAAEIEIFGFEPLNHRTLHKDAYNKMEGALLDDLLANAAIVKPTINKSSEPRSLYDDSDADGRIIE